MKELINSHKNMLRMIKRQMGLSEYGMYWLAFFEGGLSIWFLDKLFLNLLNN